MRNYILILLVYLAATAGNKVAAQTSGAKQDAIEDSTIGLKPTLKIENISPAGHCDNQEFTFFAPWADHFEISKRRIDTGWIKDNQPRDTWFSQTLKPGVTGMIYKRLDERGTYQFVVKGFKGNRYRESEIITVKSCAGTQ